MSNYIQPLILPPIFLAVGFPFFKVTNELNEPAADMQSRQQTAKWVEINSERTFFTVLFLRDISSILAFGPKYASIPNQNQFQPIVDCIAAPVCTRGRR